MIFDFLGFVLLCLDFEEIETVLMPTYSGEDDLCHVTGNQEPNKKETHTPHFHP